MGCVSAKKKMGSVKGSCRIGMMPTEMEEGTGVCVVLLEGRVYRSPWHAKAVLHLIALAKEEFGEKHRHTGKVCRLSFCQPCLKNRYGEDAKEANDLPDWKCPKCRGNCNCSVCQRRKGLQPIGRQTKPAKRKGDSIGLGMMTATEDATSERNLSIL
ncbi:hypothetical protein L6164_007690 [Bauhinia variegata]|uniref:Uncharacterized protein n=1 Tax=Bauhinia variegata TaxID=167791 RepID=A0ACB9PFU6_BAUVA|nr:hypothetical protein L6164_007690 [Bauhinia variegata]